MREKSGPATPQLILALLDQDPELLFEAQAALTRGGAGQASASDLSIETILDLTQYTAVQYAREAQASQKAWSAQELSQALDQIGPRTALVRRAARAALDSFALKSVSAAELPQLIQQLNQGAFIEKLRALQRLAISPATTDFQASRPGVMALAMDPRLRPYALAVLARLKISNETVGVLLPLDTFAAVGISRRIKFRRPL